MDDKLPEFPFVVLCGCNALGVPHAYLHYLQEDGRAAKHGPFASVATGLAYINAGEAAWATDDRSGLHPVRAQELRRQLAELDLPTAETDADREALLRNAVVYQSLLAGVFPSFIERLDIAALQRILLEVGTPFDPEGPGTGIVWNRLEALKADLQTGTWPASRLPFAGGEADGDGPRLITVLLNAEGV